MGGDNVLVSVRAVTSFVVLPRDSRAWEDILVRSANVDATVANALKAGGYDVQSVRIVANAFGEYLDCSSEQTALRDMTILRQILSGPRMPSGFRIRFAIGAAKTEQELLLVPTLIREFGDLANVCLNVGVDELGVPNRRMCDAAADVMLKLSTGTVRGEGNFNFTVNFNCPPLIPYFPAGYNTNLQNFAIGIEYPDLLVQVLHDNHAALQQEADDNKEEKKDVDWHKAFVAMQRALQDHVDSIVAIARRVSDQVQVPFAGLDSSPAPHKDIASMVEVFRLLGVRFGSPGTLQCSQYLTRLFKSVRGVQLIGFSGLMLTCLEDQGMADSAIADTYDITDLNAYSAVCGIGLDCVPVPGNISKATLIALMGDTGTLAFKLNKPLTVRLFPCPGLVAGDMTRFDSPDLCNCTVFDVS